MNAQPHSIFISYRRIDSVYAVDQLDERLKLAFGADAVFRDASSIVPGAVFPERIRRALDVARVALVVVGPDGCARRRTQTTSIVPDGSTIPLTGFASRSKRSSDVEMPSQSFRFFLAVLPFRSQPIYPLRSRPCRVATE